MGPRFSRKVREELQRRESGGEKIRNQDFRDSRSPQEQGRVFQSFIVKATLTPLGAPLFQRNGEPNRRG